MKKILIYDDLISGHHLEYLSHLLSCVQHQKAKYFFVVPHTIKNIKTSFSSVDNVEFVYLNDFELRQVLHAGYFLNAYYRSRMISKYAKRYDVDDIFLITLCHSLPLLPFFLPRKVRVTGIIYRIYFYEWKKLKWITKVKDVLENLVISRFKAIKHALVLNDSAATCYFNKKYSTSKFVFIPDPIIHVTTPIDSIREKLSIAEDSQVFLHFGAMCKRKGTLTILNSIKLLDAVSLKNKAFIFAGVIKDDIKEDFDRIVTELRQCNVKIIVFNEFCSYSFLLSLCTTADCLLIPYSNVSFSSGVLGYAALTNSCIIGPKEGLLAKLIRRNHLGTTTDTSNPISLAEAITQFEKPKINSNSYCSKNSIANFCSVINRTLFDS